MTDKWIDFEYGEFEYSINSFGKIIKKETGQTIAQSINKDGYAMIALGKTKYRKTFRVHRLVAQYFVENPHNKEEVNHIDFDRSNNYYRNLEWCSHRENIFYSIENNRMNYQNCDISGSNNPNYGNRKLSVKYSENPELSKQNQSRPNEQNGRCRKVRMTNDNGFDMIFPYLKKCAEYMIFHGISKCKSPNSIMSQIWRADKEGSLYKGYSFKYL